MNYHQPPPDHISDRELFKRGKKRQFVLVARYMNIICCLLMLVDTIIRFTSFGTPATQGDPFFYMLTFYLIGFSGLLFAAEIRYTKVIVYLELLRGRTGKGMFMILIGLLLFDNNLVIDMSVAIILVLVGLFNIIVACMRNDMNTEPLQVEETPGCYESDFEDEEEEDEEDF